jgi:putative transposase
MSRYRLLPSPAQQVVLRGHCAQARFVWNLAVEQHRHWRPGRKSAPGYLEQCRQLTAARAEHPWLAGGPQMVQQQALRDFARATANYLGGTHHRPSWRKAGRNEGFRVVALKPRDVRRLSRHVGAVRVPKAGWVRFRWSRAVPPDVKSCRVTLDRAGRWHVAFAAVPAPERAAVHRWTALPIPPRTDWAEKASTGLARRFDVIRVENLDITGMTRSVAGSAAEPGRNVRQKSGLNRAILAQGWGLLARRLRDKAPGRVEKVKPHFTSQRCSACGHVDPKSRESQARFACTACNFAGNADVNAARNIAAGHAVTARGGDGAARPVNREPQLLLQSGQ